MRRAPPEDSGRRPCAYALTTGGFSARCGFGGLLRRLLLGAFGLLGRSLLGRLLGAVFGLRLLAGLVRLARFHHPLDQSHRGVVAATVAELDDAGVTTRTTLEA